MGLFKTEDELVPVTIDIRYFRLLLRRRSTQDVRRQAEDEWTYRDPYDR